jgi:hypothetical protein
VRMNCLDRLGGQGHSRRHCHGSRRQLFGERDRDTKGQILELPPDSDMDQRHRDSWYLEIISQRGARAAPIGSHWRQLTSCGPHRGRQNHGTTEFEPTLMVAPMAIRQRKLNSQLRHFEQASTDIETRVNCRSNWRHL